MGQESYSIMPIMGENEEEWSHHIPTGDVKWKRQNRGSPFRMVLVTSIKPSLGLHLLAHSMEMLGNVWKDTMATPGEGCGASGAGGSESDGHCISMYSFKFSECILTYK